MMRRFGDKEMKMKMKMRIRMKSRYEAQKRDLLKGYSIGSGKQKYAIKDDDKDAKIFNRKRIIKNNSV